MITVFGGIASLLLAGFFAATPSSTNYTIPSYDFGNGGDTGSSSSYKVNGTTGTQSGTSQQTSTNYSSNPGQQSVQQTNVPPAPSLTNPLNDYGRLKLVLDTGNNPSDTKFAIAISPDNFATVTKYVKSDNTIGNTLTSGDRQTYASWGGASGFYILGLSSSTTYTVKVKAIQGGLNESAYGPISSAATQNTSLSFAVATSATSTPPFNIAIPSMSNGVVASSSNDVIVTLTANALAGGAVYVKDTQAGLRSISQGITLTSATADLTSVAKGYGAQVISAGQTLGGPIAASSPFNGASDNVGGLTTALQPLTTIGGSISTGTATIRLKAKSDATILDASDYSDTLSFIAAMVF